MHLQHLLGLDGRVLDLGCGPGHWSAFLHARGADVTGVDQVPEFVERYLAGTLDEGRARLLERHLQACVQCSDQVAEFHEFQRIVADPASVSVIRYTPTRPFVVRVNDTGDLTGLIPKKGEVSSDAAGGGGAGA